EGEPLNITTLLVAAEELLVSEPYLLTDGSSPCATKARQQVTNAVKAGTLSPAAYDESVRPEISINNPDVFYLPWLDLYRNPPSHWQAMRCILGKAWRMSEGSLTHGEVAKLFF